MLVAWRVERPEGGNARFGLEGYNCLVCAEEALKERYPGWKVQVVEVERRRDDPELVRLV